MIFQLSKSSIARGVGKRKLTTSGRMWRDSFAGGVKKSHRTESTAYGRHSFIFSESKNA